MYLIIRYLMGGRCSAYRNSFDEFEKKVCFRLGDFF